MSDVNSIYSSSSRITGLYSQLDTDKIVKDLLKVGQSKIDGKEQTKTKQEWYRDALGSVDDLVEDFRNTYLSKLGEGSMASSATYKCFTADVSDTTVVSIKTMSGALTGSYTIDSITQLAQNAGISSTGRISTDGTSISDSNITTLKDLSFANKLTFDASGQISFKINDVSFTFGKDTTLQNMINTVNANEDAGVTMKYSRLTDGFTITADSGGAESSVTIENVSGNAFGLNSAFGIANGTTGNAYAAAVSSAGSFVDSGVFVSAGITRYSTLGEMDSAASGVLFNGEATLDFTINGESFSFGSSTSILDMMYTVNNSTAGVKLSFDSTTGGFSLTSVETGEDAEITITNERGNAFGDFGVFGIDVGTVSGSIYGEMGQDAVCSIEGVAVTRDSNDFTIDGISYTLKNTTSEAVDVTITRDFSATVDSVKTFINAYNELTDKLNLLLDEKDYSKDYKPLTAAQEDDLSDNQIEKWNSKAKSGLMRNNDDLEGFLRDMRNAFFSSVGGTGKTMADIGITTAGFFSDDAGKIVIDEDKLTAALEDNPESVVSMFTETESGSKGLVYRLADAANAYKNVINEDEKTINKQLGKLDKKIDEMEDDLKDMAERYYKKFSVMEQSLAKLNSMTGMLSSLLSS